MANVSKKQHCYTVGELIEALSEYDPSTPLECGIDQMCTVYLCTPDKDEIMEGPWLSITGRDPWDYDEDGEDEDGWGKE